MLRRFVGRWFADVFENRSSASSSGWSGPTKCETRSRNYQQYALIIPLLYSVYFVSVLTGCWTPTLFVRWEMTASSVQLNIFVNTGALSPAKPYKPDCLTQFFFYARSRKSWKAAIRFDISVLLSPCISAAPTGRISPKFGVAGLLWKYAEEFHILLKSGSLYEDLIAFCCSGRNQIAIKAFSSSGEVTES
jgi:hypothetical protein